MNDPLHPTAKELNDTLQAGAPHVHALLSSTGKRMFFPRSGIYSQAGEAGRLATHLNGTIGIATDARTPLHLQTVHAHLQNIDPRDAYPYATTCGVPELRDAWRTKILSENPDLPERLTGTPIVTAGLTHAISLIADLFVDPRTPVILPDLSWDTYRLTFETKRGGSLRTYDLFNTYGGFNISGLRDRLHECLVLGEQKAVVILNFPHNPTGFVPNNDEARALLKTLREAAQAGLKIVALVDDAYFGFVYGSGVKTSLFGRLAGLHEHILAVKADGVSKELYAWGLRIGFLTFAHWHTSVRSALEEKAAGLVNATVSSASHPMQTALLNALRDPGTQQERTAKLELLKRRYRVVQSLLESGRFDDAWTPYTSGGGYFVTLRLKYANAEVVRQRLLHEDGIGIIALGDERVRVAYSSVDEHDLPRLFLKLHEAVRLSRKAAV